MPGVGPVVALTFKSAVDDPHRFARSKSVGAHFGMTPRKYQSGETDVTGGIRRVGDAAVRTTLYQAAHIILSREMPYSSLKVWAMQVAKRRGMKRAKVACARKLAVQRTYAAFGHGSLSPCIACGSRKPTSAGGKRPPQPRKQTRRRSSGQDRQRPSCPSAAC